MEDIELGSATIQAGDDRSFEVALRENSSGAFLKISELTQSHHNKVIIPASGIAAVFAELEACIARGPGAPASGASTTEEDQHRVTTIYTKKLKTEGKIVFIDLMEKSWGRYLKISTRTGASQGKSTVVVPATYLGQLITAVRTACHLSDGVDAVATLTSRFPQELPKSRSLRDGGRTIHMEVQRNQHGTFMRMYQRVQDRNTDTGLALTVPAHLWRELASNLNALADEHEGASGSGASGHASTTTSSAAAAPTRAAHTAAPSHDDQVHHRHGSAAAQPVSQRPVRADASEKPVGERRSLWVQNLSWSVDDTGLREVFGKYGELDAENTKVVLNRQGKSSGTAVVTFKKPQDAAAALESCEGLELGEPSRVIRVKWDRRA